jgi:hypothetical protein
MVAVEHCPRLVAGHLHRHALQHPTIDHASNCRPAEVVPVRPWNPRLLTRRGPGLAVVYASLPGALPLAQVCEQVRNDPTKPPREQLYPRHVGCHHPARAGGRPACENCPRLEGLFANLREYHNALSLDVTAPNADTLDSSAFLDLITYPYVLSLPEGGRSYLTQRGPCCHHSSHIAARS